MAKTKVELQNYQGESLSPITIASNVLYEDGRNAQEVFEEYSNETFTPTIENSSSMFKVGQGDSVDYSGNIVNGAYESMVLKGKSMVNCIQEPSSQDVVLPYEFEEGRYVTINDTKESGALGVELKGRTLVNLISDITQIKSTATVELIEYSLSPMSFVAKYGNTVSNTSNNRIVIYTPFKERLKLNKDYTIVYDYELLENPDNVDCQIAIAVDMWGQMAESPVIQTKGSKGRVVHRQNRASNNISTTFNFINNQGTNAKWKISNLMLLEGDWTNKEIPPYFEGMTSCKMPILHTVGNLFDAQKITPTSTFTYSHSTNTGRFEFTNRVDVVANTNIQLPAGTYDISFLVRGACDNGRVAITFAKDGQVWHNCSRVEINYGEIGSTTFKEVKSQRTFDAPVTVTIAGHAWSGSAIGSGWCEFKDIRFTPVGKTSILSLPEDLELRAIGDVKDTLDLTTGEVVQNIYEFTLDGSQNIDNDGDLLYYYLPFGVHNNKSISDKLPSITVGQIVDGLVGIAPQHRGNSSRVYIKVNGITTKEEMKNFFLNNPTTIQCILATPTIKTVDLNVVDQNGNVIPTLKSWNTTTHIYSEIPENTLHPTLSHSNPSYPVILKPSTKYSIVANSYSNNHTNSTINFNLGGATTSTTVGNRVTTITTPSTLSNELLTMSGRGNKLNNVMVIEGDVVGDEPYFEGICDCKSPILSNVGKNLFTTNNMRTGNIAGNGSSIEGNDISGNWQVTDYIPVKPLIKYYHSTSLYKFEKVSFYDINKKIIYGTGVNNFKTGVISTPHQCAYARYVVMKDSSTNNSLSLEELVSNNDIVVTQGGSNIAYEPYKSNTTTFDQKDDKTIVLRSLPNGVCDTLNVETGEYVKRIGEVVLDGSSDETWKMQSDVGNGKTRFIVVNKTDDRKVYSSQRTTGYLLCDKFREVSFYDLYVEGKDGVAGWEAGKTISFVNGMTVLSDFISLISQSPITLHYELETPIIKTVDLSGYPFSYENGHVQLSSGSIEQSLTPKVEYSVATNRNGQIRSNQKMVEKHQQHLDQLQAMIISNMVNTQYQQTLTTLNYDLLKKEVGE